MAMENSNFFCAIANLAPIVPSKVAPTTTSFSQSTHHTLSSKPTHTNYLNFY